MTRNPLRSARGKDAECRFRFWDARGLRFDVGMVFEQDWRQLFLEVVAKNAAHCCSTFVPPHFGHLTLLLSCSVTVKMVENFFSQDLQDTHIGAWHPPLLSDFSE